MPTAEAPVVASVTTEPTEIPAEAVADVVASDQPEAIATVEEISPAQPVEEVTEVEAAAATPALVTEAEEISEPAIAAVPEPAVAAPEVVAVVEPEPASTDGITADGRACNDPRVAACPVEVVEITTTHPKLFGDTVAPSVTPSGRTVARASNDPRGPVQESVMAEATG